MIYLSTDHAGFEIAKKIYKFLKATGYEIEDLGPLSLDPGDDYPDYGFKLAQKTALNEDNKGILVCRSGAGMSIVANKTKGIRAVVCLSPLQAKKSREHNDANVLVLAADFTTFGQMKPIIKTFLETKFSGESRHVRRLEKIKKFERRSL